MPKRRFGLCGVLLVQGHAGPGGLEEVVGGKQGALGDAMSDRCLVIVRYAGNSRRKRGHDSAQPSWAVERLPLNSPQASKRGEEEWLIVVAGGRRMKTSVNR